MPRTAKDPATAMPAIDFVPTPPLSSPPSVLEGEAEEEVAVPELVTVRVRVLTAPSEPVSTVADTGRLVEVGRGVLIGVEAGVLAGGEVVVVDVGGGCVDVVSDELVADSEVVVEVSIALLSDAISEEGP